MRMFGGGTGATGVDGGWRDGGGARPATAEKAGVRRLQLEKLGIVVEQGKLVISFFITQIVEQRALGIVRTERGGREALVRRTLRDVRSQQRLREETRVR